MIEVGLGLETAANVGEDLLFGMLLAVPTAFGKTSRDSSNRMIRCIFSHLAFEVYCAVHTARTTANMAEREK